MLTDALSASALARCSSLYFSPSSFCLRLRRWLMRREVQIPYQGRTQSKSAWAHELGITPRGMEQRLRSWPLDRAMTEPGDSRGQLLFHEGRAQTVAAWAAELGITHGFFERLLLILLRQIA